MNVLIMDDERLARDKLHTLINSIDEESKCFEAENAIKGLGIIKKNDIHLALLDIEMPGMTGIELSNKLARFSNPPSVVYTTAYSNYALPAFAFPAIGYLLKPIKQNELIKMMTTVKRRRLTILDEEIENAFTINYNANGLKQIIKIPLQEVSVLYAQTKVSWTITKDARYPCDFSLQMIEDKYPSIFIRIHRNCLVNRKKIKSIATDKNGVHTICMTDINESYIISRQQWAIVKECFQNAE